MKDMIYREDAIEAVADYFDLIGFAKVYAKSIINTIPTAARPQGEWLEVDDSLISCKCSVCGWESQMHEDDVYGMPYCPNCGANMKEVDNEMR